MRPPKRATLAVDFDGVITEDGAVEALLQLDRRYRMVVFTARHDLAGVWQALRELSISHLFSDVSNRKPRADVYLDDRGLRFTDWRQALEDLL